MNLSALPQQGDCWIVAHRGVSARYPENTRVAFEAAVAAGADAIECDLQLTADDQVVVCHDDSLERFGHAGIEITKVSLDRLCSLDIGTWFAPEFHGERLMTLDELLNDVGSRLPILLELKTETLASHRATLLVQRVAEIVSACQVRDSVSFLCFDDDVLRQMAQLGTWPVLVFNTNKPQQIDADFLTLRPWLNAVDGNINELSDEVVRLVREHQRKVSCFTCNTEEELFKARKLAVDAVITNDPAETRLILQTESPVHRLS